MDVDELETSTTNNNGGNSKKKSKKKEGKDETVEDLIAKLEARGKKVLL